MIQALVIVGLLLALNGLFVAAEFAAVASRRHRIQAAAKKGKVAAKALLPIMEDPRRLDRYISSCQLGITTTSLALGAYGQHAIAGALASRLEGLGSMQLVAAHSVSIVVVLTVLTVLQMLIGEQVPKSYALARPNIVALATVRLVLWAQRLLFPFIFLLNAFSMLILKLLRAPSLVYSHVHSRQEIDLLFEQSREGGVLAREKHQQLQHALELEEISARHLMVPRPKIVSVDVDTASDSLMQQILEGPHTRLPVYKDNIDNIIGILHTKDLARRAVEQGHLGNWRPLVRPVLYVSEGMTGDRLITRFREKKTQQAIVMDEFGGVAGLVTLEDVLRHVFGTMADEFSVERAGAERLPDGRFRLPGDLRLDEVEDVLGFGLEGSATTLGGHVTDVLGHLPEEGESIDLPGCAVEVESVTDRVVESLLVRIKPLAEEAG